VKSGDQLTEAEQRHKFFKAAHKNFLASVVKCSVL
jgi:hypothetical protein